MNGPMSLPMCGGGGYPARTGWGTPRPGTHYAWTGYGAGGTPLTVSCKKTVLLCKVFYRSKRNIGKSKHAGGVDT